MRDTRCFVHDQNDEFLNGNLPIAHRKSNLGSHTLLVYESQLRPFLLKIEHQKGEAKVFALQIKSHTLPAGPSIFLKFFD